MILAEIPTTATLVSPGVWTDAPSHQKFYLDPTDSALVVVRAWTPAELATWTAAQSNAATTRANLLAAIGARVATLHAASTDATTFATAETQRAAAVAVLPLAQVTATAIRDELALLHTDLAQLGSSLSLALTSVADLADVVSNTL